MQLFEKEREIANGFCETGAVAIAINANNALMHYTGGVMDVRSCPPAGINHAVLYIGIHKNVDHGKPVHVIRNSWGADWGVSASEPYQHKAGASGHVLFAFGDNVCNIEALATAPEDVQLA